MKYRSEIDGLRAIAVLPVIFFHAGLDFFSGGYVGVDVFFVISGYLITSILISDMEVGRFSILRFYERRARRILPALFVVIAACIPFAWFWMTPALFRDFCESIVAVIFFASNVLFWSESGYFAEAAELKPLLHTWSLAVEEQYYLFFPIFLLLLPRVGRKKLFWVIVVFALVSLLLSEWAWRNATTANFYLAPTRAWELLAGSICAFVTTGRSVPSSNPVGLLGLALIIVSIFAFDDATPFPSLYAVLPVGGTMLVILFAQAGTWGARILSTPALVAIGMVSYSAYLWHQPLFAFARLKSIGEPSHLLMVSLAIAALLLAAVTWRYVEQPFRKSGTTAALPFQRAVFRNSAFGGAGLVAVALLLMQAPTRLEINEPRLFEKFEIASTITTDCPGFDSIAVSTASCRVFGSGDKIAVVWGDSHAGALAKAIQPNSGYSVYVLSHPGCPPSIGLMRVDKGRTASNCRSLDTLDQYLKYIVDLKPDAAFLVARWTLYMHGWHRQGRLLPSTSWVTDRADEKTINALSSTQALQRGLLRTLERLTETSDVHLVTQPVDLQSLGPHGRLMTESVRRADFSDWHRVERDLMAELKSRLPVEILPTKSLFCDAINCALRHDGYPLYNDDNHLSTMGASMQWKMIIDAF